jgi:hypothetical protein
MFVYACVWAPVCLCDYTHMYVCNVRPWVRPLAYELTTAWHTLSIFSLLSSGKRQMYVVIGHAFIHQHSVHLSLSLPLSPSRHSPIAEPRHPRGPNYVSPVHPRPLGARLRFIAPRDREQRWIFTRPVEATVEGWAPKLQRLHMQSHPSGLLSSLFYMNRSEI